MKQTTLESTNSTVFGGSCGGDSFLGDLMAAHRFTKTYRRWQEAKPAIREAYCLHTQAEHFFLPLVPEDGLAGRVRYPLVGFGTENTSGGSLYFCKKTRIREGTKKRGMEAPEDLIRFWENEVFLDDDLPSGQTMKGGTLIRRLPEGLLKDTTNPIANMGGRVAGACLDYDRLIQVGLGGLRKEIHRAMKKNTAPGSKPAPLHEAALMCLDTVSAVCSRYAEEAMSWAEKHPDASVRNAMTLLAGSLEEITTSRPTSFLAGVQLLWIYALASSAVNYGRMDVALGDLLEADLQNGVIEEEDALRCLQHLWRLMVERRKAAHEIAEFNARVIIGGMGRRNPEQADQFALLAMEASRTVVETEPQLTLRVYPGMNPVLWEKALSVIGEGRVYPMLYNDEVNVPAVAKAFGVSLVEAENYIPYGCGEYALERISIGSPNCSLNLLKALETVLHDGRDAVTGERIGLCAKPVTELKTFEDLFQAYARQVEYFIRKLGERHGVEYAVEGETAALVLSSLLYDGPVDNGRSILDRGTRYTGAIIESFGMVNVADSLTTIRELVFHKKICSLGDLVQAMDRPDWEGSLLHRQCLSAPKYGNDLDEADEMLERVSRHACLHAKNLAPMLGFDYFLLVNINNWFNVELGKKTAASADGRKMGGPLANGSTPTAGMDRSGVTAMLRSLAKIPADHHAGYSHNMKFSKGLFREKREQVSGLIEAYFALGGTQAMLTVVDHRELEEALLHPERHQNLIVRVGGFSARFVELAPEIQQDVLQRTLHQGD